MKRTFLTIVPFFILLMISCAGGPPAEGEPVNVDASEVLESIGASNAVSNPIEVGGGNTEITLSGLESGEIYTIYGEEKASGPKAAAPVSYLGEDTYLFILPEGESEISFTSSDIGLMHGGEFRIGRSEAESMIFADGALGMRIGQKVTEPVFVDSDGSEKYEGFFAIDVSTIEDPSRTVVTEVISHQGSGSGSHSFSFVDENGKRVGAIKNKAILDLSGYEKIYLWAQMTVVHADYDDMIMSLHILSPETIKPDGGAFISNPGTYIVEPSQEDQYLVVDGLANSNGGLGMFVNDVCPRYTSSGKRFPGVLPLAVTEESLIVNIPAHSEAIMFDYDGETLPVRLVPNDGSIETGSMGRETKTFTVPEGTYVYPVFITDCGYGRTISLSTESENSRIKLFFGGETGYGGREVNPGESVTMGSDKAAECFFFQNRSREECTFTVTIR